MEDEAPQEVRHKEAVEALVIEDEGLLGGEDEQVASVLGEELKEVIPISQGLAFEGEDHSSSPGVAVKGVLRMEINPKSPSIRQTRSISCLNIQPSNGD